ncbi:TetR/AcrR family transcriptional regulator [Streptomyces californicus]|uniref:TetR/AcrR family transcriptional regulator n=1 Tax=Streptomyces californicus TaxID=67351 RepID=UPI00296F9FE8|nr:TetR/AcrR family transcriptional regulator [Streptomyces californicus]MDW4916331.1 TetR/AcrR family transcriptional regulator [Streptomyces californicus]
MPERGDHSDRGDEMVRRLVEAAGVVIDEHGYAGASTPEILRRAGGVSRGALYHHFDGKEQLGHAVLARQDAFFQRISDRTASGPPPTLWLQSLIDVSYEYTSSILTDPVLRAAVRLSIEPGPFQTATSYAGPMSAVTALLESARGSHELQDHVRPPAASRTLVGCYSGIQLLALALAERDQLRGEVAAMWSLLMPGLARPSVLARLRLAPPDS